MNERPISPSEDLVADYVRSIMRVDPPEALTDQVMRSVAGLRQQRSWFTALPSLAPALAVAVATALIIAVGLYLAGSRQIGPPSEATPTPVPTLTPEDARVLVEPGDVIRIPALDDEGQFGTITIQRYEEQAGYQDFTPFAFEDVFFVELYVKYEPQRSTDEEYGEWEFAFAADLEGNGFDDADLLQRGVGFTGLRGQPGFESAPQPILEGKRLGDDVLEGWLVLELPAAFSDVDLYLVYGHAEWTDGIENMGRDASALLRRPGEPVGVTRFDPDAPIDGSPLPLPSAYGLPSPPPSPAATFEPAANAEIDALFDEVQTCTNDDLGVTVTYPASWYTNEPLEDFVACSLFGPVPIDEGVVRAELGNSLIVMLAFDAWIGGIEEPLVERVPIADRLAWHVHWTEDQLSRGNTYLIQRTEEPYGPFILAGSGSLDGPRSDETHAVLQRILARLQITD